MVLLHSFAQPPGNNIFYHAITKHNSGALIASILMVVVAAIITFEAAIAVFASTSISAAYAVHGSFCRRYLLETVIFWLLMGIASIRSFLLDFCCITSFLNNSLGIRCTNIFENNWGFLGLLCCLSRQQPIYPLWFQIGLAFTQIGVP